MRLDPQVRITAKRAFGDCLANGWEVQVTADSTGVVTFDFLSQEVADAFCRMLEYRGSSVKRESEVRCRVQK